MQSAKPEPFTLAQLEGAKELRKRLGHILPPSFNTDFFLARWYRAYNGNFDLIENKLNELITHRRVLNYGDKDDIISAANNLDFAVKTFERFAISQLNVNEYSDDVVVFLQRMAQIMKVIPLGHVLNSYFLLQESFHQSIYRHELKTGRPSAAVVVIDLNELNLSDFINPLSTSSKLARSVVQIWSEYFSENLIRLYLINPPGIISLMWQIAKQILDAKTQSRIVFISKIEELGNYIAKEAIPENLGGTRRDNTGHAQPPESCISAPKPVLPKHYFTEKKFWKSCNVTEIPNATIVFLKPKIVHAVDISCKIDQTLYWLFTTQIEISFEIVYIGTKDSKTVINETVWPMIKLIVLKTPENGFLTCKKEGIYQVRFKATSYNWLTTSKLTHKICAN